MDYSDINVAQLSQAEANAARARSDLLLSQLRYNSVQNLLVSGLFAAFFSQTSEQSWLWAWWAAFVAIAVIRTMILLWLETAAEFNRRRRAGVIYACIGVTALAWGMAPLACGTGFEEMTTIVAVSWVMVVIIGGANAFQDDHIATAALALPASIPSLIALFATGENPAYAVTVAIGLVYAHLTVGCIRGRRAREIEDGLKVENANLLRQYEEQAQLAAKELDRRLRIERELRAAHHRAERLSAIDALTGIANRRHFDENLEAELSRALRLAQPVSVILMDVDCFKQFNDAFGHNAGDDCLAEIGQLLARFARRSGDLAARYGGEEFVLLLPNSTREAARAIAEEMRCAIIDQAIAHESSAVAPVVTASFGVATIVPKATDTPRGLIEAADKALYSAKHSGRNQVVTTA